MHGDHIFGLPGLLLRLQTIAKPGKGTKVVQVYGPVGIHNFIANSLSLSCTELRFLRVEVFELQGGSRRWRHPGASRTYQEYRHRGIERRAVPQNLDGTWTLLSVNEITSPDQAEKMSTHFHGVNVRAAEVEHTPKVHCFGFVVEEPQRQPASIDKDRAIAAGVRPGEKYRLLKLGFPVMSDDGSREVQPSEVLIGEAAQPRKLALLGDCCRVPPPMQQLCRNADLLVHEATLSEHDTGQKVDHGGHATALEAGQLANAVDAKVLALTHLPPTIRSNSSVKDVVREAQKGIRGRTRVQVAFDFMEIQIPRSGFSFSQRATLMKAKQDEDNDLTEAAEKE